VKLCACECQCGNLTSTLRKRFCDPCGIHRDNDVKKAYAKNHPDIRALSTKTYRDANKEKLKAITTAWRKKQPSGYLGPKRQAVVDYVNEQKSKPCMDCGGLFPPECMDFDHRPEEKKSFGISSFVARGGSLDLVALEIAKCDLVCANCHRVRTRRRAFRDLP
jgi:hypothetical protein